MTFRTLLIGGAFALASAGALAHGGASGIVLERMQAMESMGKVVKSLAAMMRGETPYDADAIRTGARIIEGHAGEALTSQFPEGSNTGTSEAKAEIWQDWESFEELADQLAVLAEGLAAAADNGLMMAGPGAQGPAGAGMMGSGMMGGGMMGAAPMGPGMMGAAPMAPGMIAGARDIDVEALAAMPADGVFNMLTQSCSSCHTRFRQEKK